MLISSLSLWIFLSSCIVERGVFIFPSVTVDLSVSFSSIMFLLLFSLLHTNEGLLYVLILLSVYNVLLCIWSFSFLWILLYLINKQGIPAFLWLMFTWYILLHRFIFILTWLYYFWVSYRPGITNLWLRMALNVTQHEFLKHYGIFFCDFFFSSQLLLVLVYILCGTKIILPVCTGKPKG